MYFGDVVDGRMELSEIGDMHYNSLVKSRKSMIMLRSLNLW